jgi:hypothetical protein
VIATAWNDGRQATSGAGYGLRISKVDRDNHFRREWEKVAVQLPDRDRPVMVDITPSFWRNCSELRHKEIGRWLRANELAPWPKGRPPAFEMQPLANNQFQVIEKRKG